MQLAAVLWDMDGVLIDSMGAHAAAWLRAAGELGLNELNELELYKREGEQGAACARAIIQAHGLMPTRKRVEQFVKLKEQIFAAAGPVRPFPGALEALEAVAGRGLLMALVTGTCRDELDAALPEPIRRRFKVLITGDMVRHGKPGPEPYLKAALALNVLPIRCLVVENAPYGLRSAKAAGALVAVIPTSLPREELPGADFYLEGIQEVPALIDKLLQQT